ncbi:sulfurtransferase TusD [Shewanella algicola]|uniref:Sulfurtransferase complex subunit TusD n=1 Tax=Shewanella algicola TaxID=640633 RepID=A0A9X1Z296_9GAMM|nr:sulfurtransferase complex subunit TusD [Shewanella algicola]MCL1104046.1 sulfurtransferase complex subunit TusD [Shewanella algicola]GGP40517.1 sulfurtransferase TusD [Shewanella algicola]
MSKFIIQVNGSVYGSSASFRALAFCQSVLANGHDIITVFFYQDGVTNSNALTCPASDEIDMHAQWQAFAQRHQVSLTNCVSAALRRGVLSQQEAVENGKSHWNSSEHFSMGGLGELVVGIEKADRLISF